MYTNIDIDLGLKSIKSAFQRYPDHRRPDKDILELLELSLKGNDFEFNGEIFQQIKGCAMGKRFSPNFASIFMAEWESDILHKCHQQPFIYLRYLDDIFIIWQHTLEDLHIFIDTLNSHDSSIKLQPTIDHTSVDFLDVTIYKGHTYHTTGYLDYKVFFKPTDTHQLLHAGSYHPPHTFKGVIKSQIFRFYRNCSSLDFFNQACSVLFKALLPRKYSIRLLRRMKSNTVRQIMFPPSSPDTLTSPSRVYHYRPTFLSGTSMKCLKTRCKLDIYVPDRGTFFGEQTRNKYQMAENLNCDSSNIVYVITCKKCRKQYVGETQNSLRQRAANHLSSIRLKHDVPVAQHFNTQGHSVKDHFEIMPIEKIPFLTSAADTKHKRLERESFWIQTLQTIYPLGLNLDPGRCREKTIIPFVFQYNKASIAMAKIIVEEYKLLQSKLARPLTQRPVIAYKKNKSLKDILVRAKLPCLPST